MDVRRRMLIKKTSSGDSGGGSTTSGSYTVVLNSQWQKSTTISNPDSNTYDGVYESYSNKGVNNSAAVMYIDISGLSEFSFYIRSYAESSFDYVMVSQLDKTITSGSSYSDTTLVKAHTLGNQQSGTSISSYTLVEFTGIDKGSHRITVLYRKDSSQHSNDDRGYVLIPKGYGSSDSGGDSGGGDIITDNYNYMTIYALEDGLQAKISANTVSYSIDEGTTWTELASDTYTPTVNRGQTIMFKGNITPSSSNGIGTFTINKRCNLMGNCNSLLFGAAASNNNLSGKDYAFYRLFSDCTTIVEVSSTFLPSTTLSSSCYFYMFYGCTSLVNAPALPSTTLYSSCYSKMFYGCTSLVNAPALPATTLSSSCYSSMFYGCTNLVNAPSVLPATTLYKNCYSYMFYNCIGLTTTPALPATILVDSSYDHMFYGTNVLPDCSNINFRSLSEGSLRGLFAGTKVTDEDLFNILPINPSTGKYWLPATSLYKNCYLDMFYGCRSLVTAPELPATTLSMQCYAGMFQYCSRLVNAPELPATKLSNGCYINMFKYCYGLVTAPALPATTLDYECYYHMFEGCSSLVNAPELPATKLSNGCYSSMFDSCDSLVNAPALPATTLTIGCYNSMFKDCISLVTAPELPATTLAEQCYYYMFWNCNNLKYIKMLSTDISASSCLSQWVFKVSSTGTFVKNPDMTSLPTGTSGIPSGWTVVDDTGSINTDNYMTILALEDGLTAKLSTNACQYCIDGGGNWIDLPSGTNTQSINQGQTLSFRGNLTPSSSSGIGTFTISKKCNLEGNCMSLLFGDDAVNNNSLSGKSYAFYWLFKDCTTIIQVSDSFLPATTLSDGCYRNMFYGCTSLTIAPELPATKLSSRCYSDMFFDCTRLTTAPELPATTLSDSCYSSMFYGCTSLTIAPELPATTLANYCYGSMFDGTNVLPDCSNIDFTSNTVVGSGGLKGLFDGTKVTDNDLYNILPINPSTGKYWLPVTTLSDSCYSSMFYDCTRLTTAPELPATTLSDSCYSSMFYGCTSLTTAPELPATTLADSCYNNMFYNCTSLTTAPELPATTLAENCYSFMFDNCEALTTAPELPATKLIYRCYMSMFSGCTSLTTAPELPATKLASRCYSHMFSGCNKLNYIKMLATGSATNCLDYWVFNVSSTGTFVKNPDMTSLPTGGDGIPSGWTVYNAGDANEPERPKIVM